MSSNPFRTLSLVYTIPRGGRVHLFVLDVAVRQRALLVNEEQEPGSHPATWDGRDSYGAGCSPGVYFVRPLAFDSGRATSADAEGLSSLCSLAGLLASDCGLRRSRAA